MSFKSTDKVATIVRRAKQQMKERNIDYLFEHHGVHLGTIPFESNNHKAVLPLLVCGDGILVVDRKTLKSNRRMRVFRTGNVVFKRGEVQAGINYHISNEEANDPKVVNAGNTNLLKEIGKRIEYEFMGALVEPVLMVVNDTLNGVYYSVEVAKQTMANFARAYAPLDSKHVVNLEDAVKRFYIQAEDNGLTYIHRLNGGGEVDLGDLLIEDRRGKLHITATDNPIFKPNAEAEYDNLSSYKRLITSFYSKLEETHKKK